ncbi:hypothetical protein F9B85_11005 [Heliorestis acidaminivorans]|uniref:Uncharacterized protein n=1 Tax=Heliorestis acidaminivorans TaxID=553427 RepID=A0A6I0ESH3_9FIRM|nr:hypothetical protein [Heliorestis acidaminivorans]KAB2951812.1 hypothetical protein F9B85_11005 [Heliorestis acidaminivorans]
MLRWKILHKIPGRMRLQILESSPQSLWFDRLESMERLSAVQSVDYNALSKTVLIKYDVAKITEQALLALLSAPKDTFALNNVSKTTTTPALALLKVGAGVVLVMVHRKLFRLRIGNMLWWSIVAYLLKKHYPIIRARLRRLGILESRKAFTAAVLPAKASPVKREIAKALPPRA